MPTPKSINDAISSSSRVGNGEPWEVQKEDSKHKILKILNTDKSCSDYKQNIEKIGCGNLRLSVKVIIVHLMTTVTNVTILLAYVPLPEEITLA